jgi:hypothetical protein
MKVTPKVINIQLYTNQKETKQYIFKSLHVTWFPIWLNLHINVKKTFHMNYNVWINAH